LLPVRRWGGRADEVLHTHDYDGGFAPPVDNETFIVLHGAIHDLPELRSGNVGIYSALHHGSNASIDALILSHPKLPSSRPE
jgi:hypothetical protein